MIFDLFMPAMINNRFGSLSQPLSLISKLFALFTTAVIIYLAYFVIRILLKIEKSSKDKVESTHLKHIWNPWLELRESILEETDFLRKFTPEIMMICDLLTCTAIVLFYSNGLVQIIPVFLFKLAVVILLGKNSFKSKKEWIISLVNEAGILGCLLGLTFSEIIGDGINFKTRYKVLGTSIIGVILLTIAFNLLIAIAELYFYYKAYKLRKKNGPVDESKGSNLKKIFEARSRTAKVKIKKR